MEGMGLREQPPQSREHLGKHSPEKQILTAEGEFKARTGFLR